MKHGRRDAYLSSHAFFRYETVNDALKYVGRYIMDEEALKIFEEEVFPWIKGRPSFLALFLKKWLEDLPQLTDDGQSYGERVPMTAGLVQLTGNFLDGRDSYSGIVDEPAVLESLSKCATQWLTQLTHLQTENARTKGQIFKTFVINHIASSREPATVQAAFKLGGYRRNNDLDNHKLWSRPFKILNPQIPGGPLARGSVLTKPHHFDTTTSTADQTRYTLQDFSQSPEATFYYPDEGLGPVLPLPLTSRLDQSQQLGKGTGWLP